MKTESFNWPGKLAAAVQDRGVDWSARLGADSIAAHSFILEGETTAALAPLSPEGKVTKARVSGGVAGETLSVIASATASGGQVHVVRVAMVIA